MNCLFIGGVWDGKVIPFDDPPEQLIAPVPPPFRRIIPIEDHPFRIPSEYQTYIGYLNVCPGKCYFTIYVIDTMNIDDAWNRIFSFYINEVGAHVDTH